VGTLMAPGTFQSMQPLMMCHACMFAVLLEGGIH